MRAMCDFRTVSSRLGRIRTLFLGGVLAAGAGPAWALPPVSPQARPVSADGALPVHRVAVFGTDTRSRLPQRMRSLRNSIGLIYNDRTRTVCTAFCVADDVIATASHCVFRTKGETPPPPERFYFTRPGTRFASARFAGSSARASGQNIIAGTVGISTKPPIDAARDWALVKLQTPACRGQALPVEPMNPDEIEREATADRVFHAAFHRDFGSWAMAHSGNCTAGRHIEGTAGPALARDFTDPNNLVLHTCDTGGASSGSPLLIETPAGPKVVAINVGTFVRSRVVLQEGVVVTRMPSAPVANTAVSASAFAHRLEPFRQTSVLTAPADVRDMQRRLARLDLLDAAPRRNFDERTRSAIQVYEERIGLPVTGLPTRALLERLQSTPPVLPRPSARGTVERR